MLRSELAELPQSGKIQASLLLPSHFDWLSAHLLFNQLVMYSAPSPPQPVTEQPTIRRRLAVMLYESLLLLGVLSVAFIVPHLLLGMAAGITLPGPVLLAHLLAVCALYFVWYWTHGGQTLAMQTWKLRITQLDASDVSVAKALWRFVLAVPSVLCGIGVLWAVFDPERQFLHDRLAGTRVVLVAGPTSHPSIT